MSADLGSLTGAVIAAFYRVCRALPLRRGMSEEAFVEALAAEIESGGHAVRRRAGGVDLLVDEAVPVEVAKAAHLTPQHEAELRACLREGGWPVGVLVNFGAAQVEVRRVYEADHFHHRWF